MNKWICTTCGFKHHEPVSHKRLIEGLFDCHNCPGSFQLIKEFSESFTKESVIKEVSICPHGYLYQDADHNCPEGYTIYVPKYPNPLVELSEDSKLHRLLHWARKRLWHEPGFGQCYKDKTVEELIKKINSMLGEK